MPRIPFIEQQLAPSANVGAVRVDPGMRSGEFAALRQIGGAVRQIGDVAADYGMKLKQARAVDQRIQGETRALAAFDEIKDGFLTRRDHQAFQADFDAQAGELRGKLLDDPGLEPEAKQSLAQFFDRQVIAERGRVLGLAFSKWQDQSRAGLDLALTDSEKRGDSARARAAQEGAKAAGYSTDQEYEAKGQAIGRNVDYYAALQDIQVWNGLSIYRAQEAQGLYPELMPEDKVKLEAYGARLEKAKVEAMAEEVEGGVIEAVSTGNYDIETELAKIDAAEAAGAIDKKIGATLRAKLRDGDIEKTSEAVQAELNAIELYTVLGDLSPDEAKKGVLERLGKATTKDAGRMLGFLKELKAEKEQALAESQKTPPALKEAYSQVDDLVKLGVFGNRQFDDKGQDITDKERQKQVKLVAEGDDKPGWGTGDYTAEEAAKENARRRAELKAGWDKEDRIYNSALDAIRKWVKENPKATPEEVREAVNGILALPLENAAFQKALKNGK